MNFFERIKNYFSKKKKTCGRKEPEAVAPEQAPKDTPAMSRDRLSENFTLLEFTNSQTAKRKKIDNSPTEEHYVNLKALATNLLQPLRDDLGKPLMISSGYRSAALNRAIGGASGSQHSKGEAADLECVGMSNKELAHYIADNYDFDQLILEFYDPTEGPNSGWVHVSYKDDGSNRKEVLSAITDGTNTSYVYGITDK